MDAIARGGAHSQFSPALCAGVRWWMIDARPRRRSQLAVTHGVADVLRFSMSRPPLRPLNFGHDQFPRAERGAELLIAPSRAVGVPMQRALRQRAKRNQPTTDNARSA